MSLDFYGHRDEDIGDAVSYSLTNLARAQAQAGDRPTIHLIASSSPSHRQLGGVAIRLHPALQFPKEWGLRWRFARQLSIPMLRNLAHEAVDVVHFHGCSQFQTMFAATAWWSDRIGLPLVAQERGYRPVGPVVRRLETYGLTRSRAVLAASAAGVQSLIQRGVPADRITLGANGYDPRVFWPTPQPQLPREPFRVLTVTRFDDQKDPLTLARGITRLAARTQRQVEVIATGNGPLLSKFQAILRTAKIPLTLIDHLPQPRLAELYRTAHVHVLTPSRAEGWSQASLEAMASGVPVVATEVRGISDCIARAGITIQPKDAGALAASLEVLMLNEKEWLIRRQAGLERASLFTWEMIAQDVRHRYAEVLDVNQA